MAHSAIDISGEMRLNPLTADPSPATYTSFAPALIGLLVVGMLLPQQTILKVAQAAHGLLELEVPATSAAATPQPRVDGQEEDNSDAAAQEGMTDETIPHVVKDLGDQGRCELVADGVGSVDDLIEGLGDGGPADHDVVAGFCLIVVYVALR